MQRFYVCECDEAIGKCPGNIPADEWEEMRVKVPNMERDIDGDLYIARKDCPNHPSPEYTILKSVGNLVLVRKND